MVAHRRLGQAERLREMADAGLSVGLGLDETENPKPRRIGQGLERTCQPLRFAGVERLTLEQRRARGRNGGDRLHELDIDTHRDCILDTGRPIT